MEMLEEWETAEVMTRKVLWVFWIRSQLGIVENVSGSLEGSRHY